MTISDLRNAATSSGAPGAVAPDASTAVGRPGKPNTVKPKARARGAPTRCTWAWR